MISFTTGSRTFLPCARDMFHPGPLFVLSLCDLFRPRSLSPSVSMSSPRHMNCHLAISFAFVLRVVPSTPENSSSKLHRLQFQLPSILYNALQQRSQRFKPCAPCPRCLPHKPPSTLAFTRVCRHSKSWHTRICCPRRSRAFYPSDPARPELLRRCFSQRCTTSLIANNCPRPRPRPRPLLS